MFTPVTRIILVILSLGMAIFFYSKEDFFNTTLTIIAAGLFSYGYFKYGTVYAAFQQLKKENYKKAEKIISKTKKVNWLNKENKGYYHFIKGLIASQKQELENSFSELIKALEIGLRTENDTSIVLLSIANIEFERKNYKQAKDFIIQGRKYNLKPLIKSEMDKLEKEINIAQNAIINED